MAISYQTNSIAKRHFKFRSLLCNMYPVLPLYVNPLRYGVFFYEFSHLKWPISVFFQRTFHLKRKWAYKQADEAVRYDPNKLLAPRFSATCPKLPLASTSTQQMYSSPVAVSMIRWEFSVHFLHCKLAEGSCGILGLHFMKLAVSRKYCGREESKKWPVLLAMLLLLSPGL